jgi:FKBP-type peptidyl-prolyl cis-trans isomerase SlpA
MEISKGKQVTLHFALKLDDGQVVDSTFDKEPATLVIGDGNLPDGFESLLVGLTAGHKESFNITPENAFAQKNPNNIQEMKRSDFAADMELEVGLMISFADANGAELPGVIKEVQDKIVMVDFNHPLAGEALTFDVEIINVENAQ